MYSQNDEQDYILNYFQNAEPGKFLDIGGYDPLIFSNTRCLVEKDWAGVYWQLVIFVNCESIYKNNQPGYTARVSGYSFLIISWGWYNLNRAAWPEYLGRCTTAKTPSLRRGRVGSRPPGSRYRPGMLSMPAEGLAAPARAGPTDKDHCPKRS